MDGTTNKRVMSGKWANVVLVLSAALAVPVIVAVAVAAPKMFTSGTAISSADVNANFDGIEKRLAALEAAAVAGPTSGLLVRQKAPFAVTTGGTIIPIDYSQTGVEYDLGGEFDSETDLFTAKKAGFYAVSCGFYVENPTPQIYLSAIIQLNRNKFAGQGARHVGGASAVTRVTATLLLKVGDSLGCAGYSNSTAVAEAGQDYANGFMVAKL